MIRLGTRGSALALAQARLVADALAEHVEIVEIRTSGDAGKGAGTDKARFVKQLEDALLEGRIDLAVHSAKDLPGELPGGLTIVGVPERADPRDALCGFNALDDLPSSAVVGTASLRRRSQLLALRPDLDVREVRGNVDTRIGKLGGEYDALVLAAAGLERLGRSEAGTPIAEELLTPAPGQGCLALEARDGDAAARAAAEAIVDATALRELTAERAAVAALGATCDTPVGARATVAGEDLTLTVYAGAPDGSAWMRDTVSGPASKPAEPGREVAARLTAVGARELIGA